MIEFIEESHTYLVNGEIVPSVTTILGATVFKDKYADIPSYILERAADFGSKVHRAIETHDISKLEDKHLHCVIEYVKLIKREDIKELEHELLLNYGYEFAGTTDLIAEYKGNKILADFKTTQKLDLEYISWQLSLYALALDFHGDLYAIWLPKKGSAELVKVERKSKEQILEMLKQYKESKGV